MLDFEPEVSLRAALINAVYSRVGFSVIEQLFQLFLTLLGSDFLATGNMWTRGVGAGREVPYS